MNWLPIPLDVLIAVPLIGLASYTILGLSGFGSAMVSIPMLIHVLPFRVVIPLVVLADFFGSVLQGLRLRGHVDKEDLRYVVPASLVGMVAGVSMLAKFSPTVLMWCLGIFVTAFGAYRLGAGTKARRVSARWGVLAGLCGGVIGGSIGVGGPIYAAYMSMRTDDHSRFRSNLSVIFLFSTAGRIALYLASGLLLQRLVWWTLPLMLLSLPFGLSIGHRIHLRLSRSQVHRLIALLLVASGISVLWRVVLG